MIKPDRKFFEKETRCDFLVDEKMKKIWAVELEMLQRFDEVCKKHDLTYWVFYGTLLGAVRHHGFVPWDDDIDLAMLRDDYERFQAVAPHEFTEPYFFQSSYTDRIIWPFSKIRDSRTTGIEFRDLKDVNQGIFIDVFPLDSVPSLDEAKNDDVFATQMLLWNVVTDPARVLLGVKQDLMEGKRRIEDVQILLDISKKDIKERFRIFENANVARFGETEEVNYIMGAFGGSNTMKREWFRDTVYLPFEYIEVPVPAEYDKILTRRYGDYHRPVKGGSTHQNIILDPDMSYREYFAKYL